MAGTKLGAYKGWVARLNKIYNMKRKDQAKYLSHMQIDRIERQKAKVQEELVRSLNEAHHEVIDSTECPYKYDEEQHTITVPSYIEYLEKGRPPGIESCVGKIREWVETVKHPTTNFQENDKTLRELDRITYRIYRKIVTEGIPPRPYRDEVVEKFRRKYKMPGFKTYFVDDDEELTVKI